MTSHSWHINISHLIHKSHCDGGRMAWNGCHFFKMFTPFIKKLQNGWCLIRFLLGPQIGRRLSFLPKMLISVEDWRPFATRKWIRHDWRSVIKMTPFWNVRFSTLYMIFTLTLIPTWYLSSTKPKSGHMYNYANMMPRYRIKKTWNNPLDPMLYATWSTAPAP